MTHRFIKILNATLCVTFFSSPLFADDSDLAKQLTNPVADLISVPFQYNYNRGINPLASGHQSYINIQPVVPITLNEKWNVISRTILPVIDQKEVLPHSGTQFGLGDTLQSLFFSPKNPQGIVWGLGPALQIPTATDTLLGTGKWAAGPTLVILKMTGAWTIGALSNQLWSFAGQSSRDSLNQVFIQPFLAYTTKSAWTTTLNSESYYYWNDGETSVPVNLIITKVTKIGNQSISFGGGPRYWITTPENGPRGWGARAVITLLFPTK